MKNRNWARWAAALLALAFPALVAAQSWPAKPVKIVVPFAAGGATDVVARLLAQKLADAWGQSVVVENRAGAGGNIGAEAVAKSPADGYTLLLGSTGTITAGPAVFKTLPYDPVKDFVAVGGIQSVPLVLTAAPKTPVSTYAEFVSLANSKKGQLSVASAGSGSSNHLAIELLMRMADLKLLHVPYKGSGPAIADLLGSQVESMMDQLTASIGYIREGRLKPLAITSRARSPLLPNVPTLDELGVKGYEASTFTGLFAPADTPHLVLDQLFSSLKKALANETVRERYRGMGVEIMDSSQAEFAAFVRADLDKWRRVAREGNIVVE